jgi:hypothetical protein
MNSQARKRSRWKPTSGAIGRIQHTTRRESNEWSRPAGAPHALERPLRIRRHVPARTRPRNAFPFLSGRYLLPSLFLAAIVSRFAREQTVPRPQPSSGHPRFGAGSNRATRADSSNSASTPHRTRTVRAPSLRARFWRATDVPAPPRCITAPAGRDRSPDVRSNPSRARRVGFTYT